MIKMLNKLDVKLLSDKPFINNEVENLNLSKKDTLD
mgnify:FL=1